MSLSSGWSIAACASILLATGRMSLAERSDARATIDKAIEAAGGREALARYQRPFYYERTGTIFPGGPKGRARPLAPYEFTVRLYFDGETFVMTKLHYRSKDTAYLEELYDDYVELDGLVYPRKITCYANGVKHFEAVTTEFKFLDEAPDSTFDVP